MKTRQAFLENGTHSIKIVYTPEYTLWLNSIEIWFSILSRCAIFKSVNESEAKISDFITYYKI
ncbi:hypothetical protein CLSAP_07250 [Clostridium saccharoperbutylacetonicum]|nr:hypothetical protein CLSAP_07250 [Clostridium saccharoperbutylacetonicum]NSB29125.1 transposase [Clostridium saccharoperbutylacetonicum]